MRLLLTFIIFILGGFYTFGDNNCCEQCCEYLENCCKKRKENKKEGEEVEVLEKFYLKKSEAANLEEIKKLVSPEWYSKKWEETSFILYEKIDGVENQDLNKNDGIKITKDKNGFSIEGNFIPENDNNEQKWALFEIKYKKEGEGEEEKTVYLYCSDIESSDLSGIFKSCKHISISVIACDTSRVTDMRYMFYNCSSLTKLNLSNFNTENVKDMSGMFSGCSSLTELDLSNFNTKNVTNTSGMFSSIPDKNFNSFTFPTSWNMIDE